MYKNYIFDLYGTLADIRTDEEDPELWNKTAEFYTANRASYTGKELRAAYLSYCASEQARSQNPWYEIELRRVFRKLYTAKGVFPRRELVEETAVFFRRTSIRKLKVYPWVFEIFEKIRSKGSGIYLLSNAQSCFTVPELKELGLYGLFDGIVISSDAEVKKPDPEIMRILLKRYGLKPEECLMVGNNQTSDVLVSKRCHIKCLYIETETSGTYRESLKADKELFREKYEELPELLELC